MKVKRWAAGSALAVALTAGTAWACADSGCDGSFNLNGVDLDCHARGMLAPGNDSRINLMFLLADRGGRSMASVKRPELDYSDVNHPSVFLDWRLLRTALFPHDAAAAESTETSYAGSRCQSYESGTTALLAAMEANRGLPASERGALSAARSGAEEVCKQSTAFQRRYGDDAKAPLPVFAGWPVVSSQPGREFLGYAQAADAFYGDRWDEARQGFGGLTGASDPFVRETATYMLIRTEFAAAQSAAFGSYGSYDGSEKVDKAATKRGLMALAAYLKTWPSGRYSKSAQGLLRRGLWLAGDYAALSKSYARMLQTVSPEQEAAAELVEEIDTKLLFNPDAKDPAIEGPLLLASQDLVAMRNTVYEDNAAAKSQLTAAALEAQAPLFAGQPELFDYLRATHAFYFSKDYRRVLQLLPDDTKRTSYSNLAFSRQMLRGMTLAALKDRNEGAFWQDLLRGSKGAWQRPLAELGLAMHFERGNQLAAVFATGSSITNTEIRSRLIDRSAGPALLRTIVTNKGNVAEERDQALYTLLANELVFGQYAAFGSDMKLPLAVRTGSAAAFATGKVSDGYPCAALAVSVAALARNPQDVPGRLCIGDFFRLHGLDYLHGEYDSAPKADELGGFAAGFPGKRNFRSGFYSSIIADPQAGANDKAYALYRAVMCYAPSGMNDCGGAEVPKSQRKAWFDRLKRDYPQSTWAKKLRYYW